MTLCSKVAWHGVHGRLASTSLADPSPKTIASTCHHMSNMSNSRRNPGPAGAETPAPIWSSLRHPGQTAVHGYPTQRQERLGARTPVFVTTHRRKVRRVSLLTISRRPRLQAPCTPRHCLGLTPPQRTKVQPMSMAPCDTSPSPSPSQPPANCTKAASSCVPRIPPRCTRHSRVPWRTRLFSSQVRYRFLNPPTRHRLRLKWASAAFMRMTSASATR